MAFGFCFGVTLLLSVWATAAKCDHIPDEAFQMECHDRYFRIAVDLSYTGPDPHFEAVDGTGVYTLTDQYAAQCGYSVRVLPLPGHVELRASYFSCHTDNKDDKEFTFNFNLIVMHEGKEDPYPLNKTCSPSLPWSPREVTCEVNYMEVSVRSEVTCPTGANKDDGNAALTPAHGSTTSDWQVMFQIDEKQLPPMNLSEARKQGYVFELTDERLVFRAPYGQPDSFSTEVNGVPVEVVHATLFSRQSWVVLMVDLVAACSMHEGSYIDDGGCMMWETPEALYPSYEDYRLNVGLRGELMAQSVAKERGYIVERHNDTVHLGIPYNAKGGYRKSFASGDLYEFYEFHLYLEQILLDDDHVETRIRFHRTLVTPLLPLAVLAENQTVPDEHTFTVYLGDFPEDVELAAVNLNGQECTLPFTDASSYTIAKVVNPNNTHGYTLKVPFDDPVVLQQFSEDAVLQYSLDINYTLTVQPENKPFYHLASVMALTDASPPVFDAVCTESGISFKLDHRPFDYLWEISIGSELLTSELAAQHGYIMSNDSQSLLLQVPLFSHGYEYKNITLEGFFGTFEIVIRDPETSELTSSTIKTCPFSTTELILCSADGWMTVVADMSLAIPTGGDPARANLLDIYCGPKETDATRALFSFPLNSCGSTVKLTSENVTYENELFYSRKKYKPVYDDSTERVIIQCAYPLAGLHRLFSVYRFESDAAGIGSIIHAPQPAAGLQSPIKPTTALGTTPARRPLPYIPATHPPARFIRVSRFYNLVGGMRKGAQGPLQTKVNASAVLREV